MIKDKRTFSSYRQMHNRCLNTKNDNYHLYGGRGIKICDRWLNSYPNFLADMGVRPEGTSLDRKDNDGDYCLENCRWSTQAEQCYNRGNSHWHILHYDNRSNYTDEELKVYDNIPDLKSIIDDLLIHYPLGKLEGGVRFIGTTHGVSTFAIFKQLSDKDVPVGGRFNNLTVVEPIKISSNGRVLYKWSCDCGKTFLMHSYNVTDNDKKSCGCHRKKKMVEKGYIDGYKTKKPYSVWQYIRIRCNSKNHKTYRTGGALGLTVCKRWDEYENFLEDMGYPETGDHTLQLRDGATVYSKENCYWKEKTRI